MPQTLSPSAKKRRKAKVGTVKVRSSNNRLQLVFTFEGKRHFVSTGLGDTPFNRKQAQDKALEIERDIAYGEFQPENLKKYKPDAACTPDDIENPPTAPSVELPEIWSRYTEARKTGKSPATIRMYGWVANRPVVN
jgi:integrase